MPKTPINNLTINQFLVVGPKDTNTEYNGEPFIQIGATQIVEDNLISIVNGGAKGETGPIGPPGVVSSLINATPPSDNIADVVGNICYDNNYLYVCVGVANENDDIIPTWKKIAFTE